jgi:hypothetical protein
MALGGEELMTYFDELCALNGVDERVVREYRRLRRLYLGRPGITGIDIGRKETSGRVADVGFCVRLHVRRKVEPSGLRNRDVFLTKNNIDSDVIEAEYIAQSDRLLMRDPLRPGVSIAHEAGSPGTLGMFVANQQQTQLYVLSAEHVLYDKQGAKKGDKVLYPARADDPAQSRPIAKLFKRDRPMDAAIAELKAGIAVDGCGVECPAAFNAIIPPRIDMQVAKSGRSTGLTHGRITGFGTAGGVVETVIIDCGAQTTQGGDSGAVWYDVASGAAVALHSGVSTGNSTRATAGILELIMSRMSIALPVAIPLP